MRRRQSGFTADHPRHGIACGKDRFDLANGVGEQPAQRPQPHPGLAKMGLCNGFVSLLDALVGEHVLHQVLGVDVGDTLGATQRGHGRQQRQRGNHRPPVGVGIV